MSAEGAYTAGDFIVDKLLLVTTSGMEIDLIKSYMGITLYEDIFSMTITGKISIMDAANIASHGPLLGQEYLHLKIRTPNFTEKSDIIDFSKNAFLVYSISKRQNIGNGIQGYVLSFASQELVKNQRIKVTQSLIGPWSDIVKKMLVDYLDTKKKITIEPSTGVKKFVAPNMRPLDLIVLGTKQAISTFKGEPTYLFYETLKGFNFRTLTSLYDEPSLLEYVPFEPGTNIIPDGQPGAGTIDVHKELRTVLDYSIVSNNDNIVNYRTGMFGSQLITHDIISKSYQTNVYNYFDNFPNELHIVSGGTEGREEFPILSELFVDEKGKRASDFPARTFMMPTSLTGGVDSQHTTENNTNPYMAYDPHKWVQRRNSQMMQLENGLNVNISVYGNTLINAGDKVLLSLKFATTIKGPRNETRDRFYRGPFLIKRIKHEFFNMEIPQHKMEMSLVKDSLEEILEDSGPSEPSAETAIAVEDYIYN
jgi:hypothetical protein